MITPKPFKETDLSEARVTEILSTPLVSINSDLNQFFNDIYNCFKLGELLFDERRFPLTNAIRRDVFIRCFPELFTAWNFAGTFESYIDIFKKIFGDDVEVLFDVPGPGILNIDITASGVQLYRVLMREIVNNQYFYSNLIDHDGNHICGAGALGIENEEELRLVLYIMSPNGIYTTITLNFGEGEEE